MMADADVLRRLTAQREAIAHLRSRADWHREVAQDFEIGGMRIAAMRHWQAASIASQAADREAAPEAGE